MGLSQSLGRWHRMSLSSAMPWQGVTNCHALAGSHKLPCPGRESHSAMPWQGGAGRSVGAGDEEFSVKQEASEVLTHPT